MQPTFREHGFLRARVAAAFAERFHNKHVAKLPAGGSSGQRVAKRERAKLDSLRIYSASAWCLLCKGLEVEQE